MKDTSSYGLVAVGAILIVLALVGLSSLVIVQPNEAKVITFFGTYVGTVVESGLWMVLPLSTKSTISLKVRNFNSQKLKVNDAEGNPVEIGAVIVFRVVDTAKASFDVDQYERFVEIQSETAIRHIAAQYPYDTFEDASTVSLRGNADEVAAELLRELQERLDVAGVQLRETRITHLAYAPEIASAMLQRQQAIAIVAARQKIVEGAVGMVDAALRQLEDNGIVLDDERRAAMINNLMVSIVSDRAAQPVINTGSLYS
ncbi:membrane protein [Paenibacillus agaridevorans]|uniref:Membrane protein n=2 Tax=Paenibacillus TaxID=44249 RepID=A0A2R5EUR4_9BACL|nr:membrane protein [Paenibacillus agaridevorans]